MLTTKRQLAERGGAESRLKHLQDLVQQYQHSKDKNVRREALAHLANFAYDPINSDVLRRLNVIELFKDCLTDEDEEMVEFGMSGLCNMAVDPLNHAAMVAGDGIVLMTERLSSSREETALSAFTTFFYLSSTMPIPEAVWAKVQDALASSSVRLRNLAATIAQHRP